MPLLSFLGEVTGLTGGYTVLTFEQLLAYACDFFVFYSTGHDMVKESQIRMNVQSQAMGADSDKGEID